MCLSVVFVLGTLATVGLVVGGESGLAVGRVGIVARYCVVPLVLSCVVLGLSVRHWVHSFLYSTRLSSRRTSRPCHILWVLPSPGGLAIHQSVACTLLGVFQRRGRVYGLGAFQQTDGAKEAVCGRAAIPP